MKQLDLEFKTGLGKTQHLKLKYVNESMNEAVVRKAMTDLADLKLFNKDGDELYVTPVGAQYVETIHEPIFSEA